MDISAGPTIHSSNQQVSGMTIARNSVVAHSPTVFGSGRERSLILNFFLPFSTILILYSCSTCFSLSLSNSRFQTAVLFILSQQHFKKLSFVQYFVAPLIELKHNSDNVQKQRNYCNCFNLVRERERKNTLKKSCFVPIKSLNFQCLFTKNAILSSK